MREKIVGKINGEPTKKSLNYHPCYINGRAPDVEAPNGRWSDIGWTYRRTKRHDIIMVCVFYVEDKVDSRASCILDDTTGTITRFRFQENNSFDENDAYCINSSIDFFRKSNDAFYYVKNLVEYFKKINDVEYENASTAVADHQFEDDDIILTGKVINPADGGGIDSIYNPTLGVHNLESTTSASCKRNYKMSSWQIHGHYRRYKNGNIIYIKPTIGHRRKELIV